MCLWLLASDLEPLVSQLDATIFAGNSFPHVN